MKKRRSPDISIKKKKLLLVEGQDEVMLIDKLLRELELTEVLQIINVNGKNNISRGLKSLMKHSDSHRISSIGIIRDADKNPKGAFDSICSALENAGLAKPKQPEELVGDKPKVAIMILPTANTEGMLETLCLQSVQEDPAMACVNQYFDCLKKQLGEAQMPKNLAKAKTAAFLSSRPELASNVGIAAQKGYWPFTHSTFSSLKAFLQLLESNHETALML